MEIKAIVFDCFDVLYISAHKTAIETFPSFKLELESLRRQANNGFFSSEEYTQAIATLTGATSQQIRQIFLESHRLNQPLLDYIARQLKPVYKIALLSNIGRGWIQNLFTSHQLHDFFDAVVISGDEGIAKPHPRVFELVAERLHLPPQQCLMIDDYLENVAGADAAGMPGIVYGNLRDMKIELREAINARTT